MAFKLWGMGINITNGVVVIYKDVIYVGIFCAKNVEEPL
jgi:hypothetical protein